HAAALRALSGWMLAAALAAGCGRSEVDEVATVDPEVAARPEQQPVPVAADAVDPGGAAKPSDAAEELQRVARQQELDAEARRIAEREAELRAREAEVARVELEERERRLRQREREVAESEARLRAEREAQARAQQAARDAELGARRDAATEADSRQASATDSAEDGARETWTGDETWRRGSRESDSVVDRTAATPSASPELLRAGMRFEVEVEETLSSGTSKVGEAFRTVLVADLRASDGRLVAPAGSAVLGEVVEVRPLRRVGGQAALGLSLDRLVLPSGDTVEIRANLIELGKNKRGDKARIAGAVVAGAILGSILGDSEGALVGAAAGAAASTAYVVKSEGREVEIPAGTVVTLEVEEVVTVRTEYRTPPRR
ncbi:MAG TPA: hypothetical protein VNB06_10165, partial [Thermoanaerobaculia bacterium]|nr:hypothetical protein [Thermoanaerobaculia bacterium]